MILIRQWMLSSIGEQDLEGHVRHNCVIVAMFFAFCYFPFFLYTCSLQKINTYFINLKKKQGSLLAMFCQLG